MDFLRADTVAIEAVCRRHGFLDAKAHARLLPGKNPRDAVVTFEVHEGERSRVGEVTFGGVTAYPQDQLRKRLLARSGRPYNPAYIVADTTRISRAYQDRGYIPHVFASMRREGLQAHVHYEVSEGPLYRFGHVQLASPIKVRESLIRRELLIRSGEIYSYPRVERSIERLYQTGLFSQVQMSAYVDSTQSSVDIDLRVRERKSRWVDAGIGSGTAERFRSTLEWGHRNVAGRGFQGMLSAELAFDGQGKFLLFRPEVSLLEPWLLRTRTRGLLTLYYDRRDDRLDPRWVIALEGKGFSFELRRELSRFARISLVSDNTFVDQTIEYLDPSLGPVAPDSSYTTHRLQLAFDRDFRDNPLDPGRGSAQNVVAEIAGGPLKGTSSFTKGVFVSAWYTPLKNDWVLAARVRAGVISPFGDTTAAVFTPDPTLDEEVQNVPLTDRFRTGGVNTIRGYNESSIPTSGGLALIEWSFELRIPVIGPFGLEVYADAGNVWLRPEYIKIGQFVPSISEEPLDPGDVRYVFGFGPRLKLPVGPLRLDLTWSLRPADGKPALKWEPQFAIGPSY
jgi:outer membrane protein assembly complex protein YaeT